MKATKPLITISLTQIANEIEHRAYYTCRVCAGTGQRYKNVCRRCGGIGLEKCGGLVRAAEDLRYELRFGRYRLTEAGQRESPVK